MPGLEPEQKCGENKDFSFRLTQIFRNGRMAQQIKTQMNRSAEHSMSRDDQRPSNERAK